MDKIILNKDEAGTVTILTRIQDDVVDAKGNPIKLAYIRTYMEPSEVQGRLSDIESALTDLQKEKADIVTAPVVKSVQIESGIPDSTPVNAGIDQANISA